MMEKIALTIPGFENIDSGLPVPTGGLFGTGQSAITVAIEFLLVAAVLFSGFYMIRGGINMMSSGGDKERFQKGRERVRYAILGLLVVFFSIFLVSFIGTLFGVPLIGQNKNPVFECGNTGQPCCPGNVCRGNNVCGRTDQTCEVR
jgi:hypothetical protein